MGHEAFMKVVEETCGSRVALTLDQDIMKELGEHVRAWEECYPLLS